MKRIRMLLATAVLLTASAGIAQATPSPDPDYQEILQPPTQGETYSKAHWQRFSERLVEALGSDHEGLRIAAMQHVIYYGTRVNVDGARHDLVRLYRDHENERVRRMAVVAIWRSQNDWAMNFLERSLDYEPDSTIKQTMRSVLTETDVVLATR